MLITERKFGVTNIGNIFFSEAPVSINIPDFDVLTYYTHKNWNEDKGFEKIQSLTTSIDLSKGIDGIWDKIKRQHKRHIRRAEKNGINVTMNNRFDDFQRFYKRFLKQKNYSGPFGSYILSSKFMQKYGILFVAEYQGEILGGNFYLHDDNNALSASIAYQLFANSINEKRRIYDANCYIHWEAIQCFSDLGIINYDFAGVNDFIRNFGGDIIPRYFYRKFNSQFYKLLFHSFF
jgi:hypothetical protein